MEISCVKYSITTGWRKLWNAIRIKCFGKFWFGNNISDFSRCERYGFRTFEMVILSTELNCESKCWVNTWKPVAMELAKGFRNRLHIGWTSCCNSSGSLGVLSWWKKLSVNTAVTELIIFGKIEFGSFRSGDPIVVETGWASLTICYNTKNINLECFIILSSAV